jgi:inhibitor of cysteine peptidase
MRNHELTRREAMVDKARVQRKLMVMLLAVLFLAFSCATRGGVTLHASDDGSQVELRRGQSMAISLEGNPTTGYTWEAVAYDEDVLRQVGEPEFTPQSDAVGAPGSQVLRFKALREGQTTLQLVYHRPWEDAEPERVFSVAVVVY